jgi:hypothetical protein
MTLSQAERQSLSARKAAQPQDQPVFRCFLSNQHRQRATQKVEPWTATPKK